MKEDKAEETSPRGVMENSIMEEDKVDETAPRGVIEDSIVEEEIVEETSAGGMEQGKVEETSAGGVIEKSIVEEENAEETSPRGVIENSIMEEEKVDEITPTGVTENSIIEEDKVEETSSGGVIENSTVEEENVQGTSTGGVIKNSSMEEEQVDETSPNGVIENSNVVAEKVEETSPRGVIENPIMEVDKVGEITENSIVEEEKVEGTSRRGVIENSNVEEEKVEDTSPTGVIEISVMEKEMVEETSAGGVIENSEKVEETSSPTRATENSILEEELVEGTPPTGVTEISLVVEGKVEWASPRGVIENSERSCSESETDFPPEASSTTSDSDSQSNSRRSHWRGMILSVLKSRSIRRLASLPPRRGVSKVASLPPLRGVSKVTVCERRSFSENTNEFSCFKPSWRNFTISELQVATKNFSSDKLIEKGGYAEVYKGRLQDRQLVAIKKLTRGTQEERTGDFLSEIGVIVHVNHPNTAKLIGYGVEGGLHLVLEFSPNGSLASVLHGSNNVLDWGIRYKIAVGTAGLLYLHETCQRRIIHRDIKTANILLTENFEPQITDFGLSKWLPDQWTHHTVTKFEGTFWVCIIYLAPEYSMHGIVDEKTDVFAFGVLLLELITGKRALEDNTEQSLVMWAKPFLDKNEFKELVDPSLGDSYDRQQMNRVASAAALCIQHSSILRPRMIQIVPLLKGNETGSDLCQRRSLHRTCSAEFFDVEDYSRSRYLKDLNRHKQIALDF
ncbi:receptor-like cytosolic serine/threonine-protein kinase RBK2 [Papaver somniferum]|uniref:receptor-like cytosolic serine/threonine-protein kinase RBK2 n=1 Tax=Papaver somniferum TaxID=3469 RepID=UPI000E6FB6EE|nr:receptor-like cytosolic serine/threonine-protein kinase RBK2 [Papaver somniferum]